MFSSKSLLQSLLHSPIDVLDVLAFCVLCLGILIQHYAFYNTVRYKLKLRGQCSAKVILFFFATILPHSLLATYARSCSTATRTYRYVLVTLVNLLN